MSEKNKNISRNNSGKAREQAKAPQRKNSI